MVLLTWGLMRTGVHPRCYPQTWESHFYFTNCTLSRSQSPSVLPPEGALRCRSLFHLRRHIYFTNYTLSRSLSSLLSTPEAAKCCQWFLATPAPNLFHQLHFV